MFRTGKHGTGYYVDNGTPISVNECLSTADFPSARLSSLRGTVERFLQLLPIDSHADGQFGPSTDPRPPRQRRRGRTRNGPMACPPTIPHAGTPHKVAPVLPTKELLDKWADNDGTYAVNDTTHREDGLWAIDSANGTTWDNACKHMSKSTADLVAFQETKRIASERVAAEAEARAIGWALKVNPCTFTDKGNPSCGVAIGARKHIGVSLPNVGLCEYPILVPDRVTAVLVGAICRGGVHFVTVYFHHSVGLKAKVNQDLLHALAAFLNFLEGPWIVSADFQGTPEQLTDTGWLELVKGAVIVAPGVPTCGKRVLDYFVVCRHLAHAAPVARTLSDHELPDHSPTRLYLRAAPRAVLVRQIVAPRGFPATLPHGPITDPGCSDHIRAIANASRLEDVDINDAATQFLRVAETQLCEISGFTVKQASLHMGREDGPGFAMRNACGPVASVRPRSTPITAAWRRTVNWLKTVTRTDAGSSMHKGAIWRLLCYNHSFPVAQHELDAMGYLDFLRFNSFLSRELLADPGAVAVILRLATFSLAQAERLAARVRANSWNSWIQEGPAAGLKRQHRMTRVPHGWISEGLAAHDEDELYLNHLPDGFREPAPVAPPGSEHRPAPRTAQQRADVADRGWATQWAAAPPGSEDTRVATNLWPAFLGQGLPAMLLDGMRRALASFPEGTGLGWDGLHPRAFVEAVCRCAECDTAALVCL